jgi:hypothetical protein
MCLLLPSKAKIAGLRTLDEMGAEEFRKRPLFRCFDQKMKNIRGRTTCKHGKWLTDL